MQANERRGFGASVRVAVAVALGLGLVTDLPANAQFWGGWGNWGNSERPQPKQQHAPQPFNLFGNLFGSAPRGRSSKTRTGFATFEASLGGKWLELLSEIAPGLKRVAIMFDPDAGPASVYMPSLEAAARSHQGRANHCALLAI
jgi:hypothetical protein